MKLNKSKNKGKVHPSPSSSSSPANNDPISSLNHLLPTAILTLISVLSLQDREVLAYLITHSLKSSTLNFPSSSSSSSSLDEKINPKKKPNKKFPSSTTSATSTHKSPSFGCGCFDCYTSFWCRWDTSPHRELIHQAIESFEEHLSSSEKTKKNGSSSARSSSKKKEKMAGCSAKVEERESSGSPGPPSSEVLVVAGDENVDVEERATKSSPEVLVLDDVEGKEKGESPVAGEDEERESGTEEKELQQQQQQQHKGLARKVLPDFIGFFQSRLWNRLWGPNV